MRELKVKICCIASKAEADLAIDHGADALGLVAQMPSGPGIIDDGLIAQITEYVGARAKTFLLTSRTRANDVVDHVAKCKPSTVQLVDTVEQSTYDALRRHFPELEIVQALHVRDEATIRAAKLVETKVDALVVDSGRVDGPVRELVGTGRAHDWGLSRQVVEAVSCPVFLAGGLGPRNVSAAIRCVQPYGLDVCSGLRTAGRLDRTKVSAYFGAIANAKTGL